MSQTPTRGEAYERLAFNFCKVATLVLLTGRWALPIAAFGAGSFYLLAYFNGKRDTRCFLMKPLLIASFWLVVAGVSVYLKIR